MKLFKIYDRLTKNYFQLNKPKELLENKITVLNAHDYMLSCKKDKNLTYDQYTNRFVIEEC